MAQRMNLLGEPGVGPATGPGRPVPSRADVREGLWQACGAFITLVIALAVLAVGSLVDRHPSQDVVTGPHGPFPAAFADGAPVAPEHVIRRRAELQVLAHGLSLRWVGSGLAAVNLRTGKEYWRYERRDADRTLFSFEASERTVVAGFDDGRLVGVDLRGGGPLWSAKVPREKGFRLVELVGGQAVTSAPGAVRAFGERDGRSLWTMRTPASCPEVLLYSVHALPDHLSAVQVMCNVVTPDRGEYSLLLGVDDRTGEVLWRRRTVDPKQTAWGDEHTLLAPDRNDEGTVRSLDVNRRGAFPRHAFPRDELDIVAAGGGTVVSGTDPGDGSAYRDTLLRAYDTRDGRLSWRLPAPDGQEYGFPVIADGRVYVVRRRLITEADVGRPLGADLLVLEAATGRLLHTLALPAQTVRDDDEYFEKLDVTDTADGALSIERRDGEGTLLVATD
ncbi:PQQ-binding-like beta-propeller repeat protein [Streptomyces sp. NPDC002580]|uniref:outer membrane protein assembly factor BamB family protein n=1 Tax=Streptomyces sp. NPDC002580 TaxID=3364653 RepID=UPI0036A342C3